MLRNSSPVSRTSRSVADETSTATGTVCNASRRACGAAGNAATADDGSSSVVEIDVTGAAIDATTAGNRPPGMENP
jgi:hypothetical protein